MIQVDKTVRQETLYLAAWSGIFSLFLQVGFLLAGKWSVAALLGTLWGAVTMLLNFFLLGLTVQKAVKKDEEDAKKLMKLSHSLRNLMVFALVVVGVVLPWFSTLAVIISLFFPRLAMTIRAFHQGGVNAE